MKHWLILLPLETNTYVVDILTERKTFYIAVYFDVFVTWFLLNHNRDFVKRLSVCEDLPWVLIDFQLLKTTDRF